jgi:hypothetical protein
VQGAEEVGDEEGELHLHLHPLKRAIWSSN